MMHYLFYSLVSEETKDKKKIIKMKGPITHRKPQEIVRTELQRYLLTKDEITQEQRFLVKKFPSEIPLFYFLPIPNGLIFPLINCSCGNRFYVTDDLSGKFVKCSKCDSEILTPMLVAKKIKDHRDSCFDKAEKFFERKFEMMKENYDMLLKYN